MEIFVNEGRSKLMINNNNKNSKQAKTIITTYNLKISEEHLKFTIEIHLNNLLHSSNFSKTFSIPYFS